MIRLCVAVLAVLSLWTWDAPARAEPAQSKAGAAEQPVLPGTEESPGYEDFEKSGPSPQDVLEQQQREDDRNVISPGLRDWLPGTDD